VSRLIGAPPGYVGFDQGGLLNRPPSQDAALCAAARRQSRRRHPVLVQLILLSGDGSRPALTDNNGRKADFRNVVLVMTTKRARRNWRAR